MTFDYPNTPYAREGSPETAFDAAESVADAAKSREAQALVLIRANASRGCTADEVADTLGWERYSSRPRLSSMKARGEIVDSGDRRKGASGRNQAVWVVPEFGPPAPEPDADDRQGSLLDLPEAA
jgi:predicted ArsR family transcriptional regulator